MIPQYRCADCGSHHIVHTTAILRLTATYTTGPTKFSEDWPRAHSTDSLRRLTEIIDDLFVAAKDAPEWGWWAAFYPRHHPVLLPRAAFRAQRPIRFQARACIKQQRHWKRRRFVQKLRRRA